MQPPNGTEMPSSSEDPGHGHGTVKSTSRMRFVLSVSINSAHPGPLGLQRLPQLERRGQHLLRSLCGARHWLSHINHDTADETALRAHALYQNKQRARGRGNRQVLKQDLRSMSRIFISRPSNNYQRAPPRRAPTRGNRRPARADVLRFAIPAYATTSIQVHNNVGDIPHRISHRRATTFDSRSSKHLCRHTTPACAEPDDHIRRSLPVPGHASLRFRPYSTKLARITATAHPTGRPASGKSRQYFNSGRGH